MIETVVTAIEDEFGVQVKKYLKRRELLVLMVCLITFLLSMPNLCPVIHILYNKFIQTQFKKLFT